MFLKRLLLILALCLVAASPAHAKRGLLLINTGDELFEVSPFPDDVIKDLPGAKDAKVGYKCSHFGLFWADVWTWDCKMVAVLGEDSYADMPNELATRFGADPQYGMNHAKRGFWNHYAFWLLVGVFVVVVALGVLPGKKKADASDEADGGAQPA